MTYLEEMKSIKDFKNLGMHQDIEAAKHYYYSLICFAAEQTNIYFSTSDSYRLFDAHFLSPNLTQSRNISIITGIKNAYDQFMLNPPHEYTIEVFQQIAACIFKEVGRDYCTTHGLFNIAKGDFRLVNRGKGKESKKFAYTVDYRYIEQEMQNFCDWLNNEKMQLQKGDEKAVYALSMEACLRFLEILPFYEGNSIIALLLMNVLQYEFKVLPIGINEVIMQQIAENLQTNGRSYTLELFTALFYYELDRTVRGAIDFYRNITFAWHGLTPFSTHKVPCTVMSALIDTSNKTFCKEAVTREQKLLLYNDTAYDLYRLILLYPHERADFFAKQLHTTTRLVNKWIRIMQKNQLITLKSNRSKNQFNIPLRKKKNTKYKYFLES